MSTINNLSTNDNSMIQLNASEKQIHKIPVVPPYRQSTKSNVNFQFQDEIQDHYQFTLKILSTENIRQRSLMPFILEKGNDPQKKHSPSKKTGGGYQFRKAIER
jgi:hypothetical protein